ELADRNPGADLFVVLGADAARGLFTWERVEEVLDSATMVVVARRGGFGELPAEVDWLPVEVPRIDVSSTELRERVRVGRSIDVLVPPSAVRAIARHDLYRAAR
ncbi:MAG: nicotinate-nucleotide adenylyltransferase, partial [Actinomycetota bacterium]